MTALATIEESPEIGEFAKAMSLFQKACPNPPLNGWNPHFRSKYALLQDVLSTVRPHMGANGLSFSQRPSVTMHESKAYVCIVTTIRHSSGQWERGYSQWPVEKAGAQAVKAALTYARGGELLSMLGIAGDLEDDGEGNETRPPTSKPAAKKAAAVKAPENPEEYIMPIGRYSKGKPLKDLKNKDLKWVCEEYSGNNEELKAACKAVLEKRMAAADGIGEKAVNRFERTGPAKEGPDDDGGYLNPENDKRLGGEGIPAVEEQGWDAEGWDHEQ